MLSEANSQEESEPALRADSAWLGRFVMHYKRGVIGSLICGAIAGVTATAVPYFIGVIIDQVRREIALGPLAVDILILLGLTFISIIAFFGQRYYSGEIAYGVNYDIREVLYDRLLMLEQGFYQRYTTGDLISRMYSDLDMIWRLLTLTFTRIGSAVLTVVATFVLLATINLPLTLVVFVILSISTTIQMRVGLMLAMMSEKVQEQAGTLSALVQDAASGIQTIKTFGREVGVAHQYRQENIEYRRRWLHFSRWNQPVGMLPNMISELTAAIVVLVGGMLAVNGTMTLGNFVQFLVYLSTISVALLQLGTIYQRYQQTRGALTRLTPLLQTPTILDKAEAQALPMAQGEITFDHIGVQIEGKWLLRDVCLTIPAGRVVALVGPTGAGKTLLVSLLARVLDPTEGRVLIDGVDVRDLKLADLRRAIAYVPQSTFLFSQPLHSNVRMAQPDLSADDLDRAIHISRLSNDLPQLPQGLDTLVGERGVMLSGGQKQRVAIARAIVRDPAILVLDDALSSVDTQTAADILADLRHVVRSRTSIIIAHRIATVRDADHIVVLVNGQIVAQGTHTSLIAQDGLYARMVERELKRELDEDETVPTNGLKTQTQAEERA